MKKVLLFIFIIILVLGSIFFYSKDVILKEEDTLLSNKTDKVDKTTAPIKHKKEARLTITI